MSIRMGSVGHVAFTERRRIHIELWLESKGEGDKQEDLDVGGKTILQLIS
jgi:hypothetical protein